MIFFIINIMTPLTPKNYILTNMLFKLPEFILASYLIFIFLFYKISKNLKKSFKSFSKKEIAYPKKFDENKWLLELYHGPTLAFKDYALQVVGNLFQYVLKREKKKLL